MLIYLFFFLCTNRLVTEGATFYLWLVPQALCFFKTLTKLNIKV